MAARRRLVRELNPDRPRTSADRGENCEAPSRRGRPPLRAEVADLQRGATFVGVESAAIAFDVLSSLLRRAVDRVFDKDYERPGDILRGITRNADETGYDLVSELRGAPRKLARRFDEAIRSPRTERGERARRAEEDDEGDSSGSHGRAHRASR